uniref:LemA family protein n=1 Tax=Succinivibrio sp. TaxID=2053619 RepID=UPI00402AF1DD
MFKSRTSMVLSAVFAFLVLYCIFSYNSLVSMDESTSAKWSNVEVQYQRRADLIPNLVNTVKGYATHEKETLENLTALRAKSFQNVSNPSEEDLKKFEETQGAITQALGRLIAVAENYPDLKANQNFLELQAQLEGTANRIAVARKDFNDTVNAFNTGVRKFP